jgi:putative transposase
MVRAGVVSHPAEWEFGGYNEIQYPRRKSILINYDKLAVLSGCDSYASFQDLHRNFINTALETDKNRKEAFWSQSIAVGEEPFVNQIKKKLGSKASGRKKYPLDYGYVLREETVSYSPDYDIKNSEIGLKNEYEWNISPDI